MLENSTLVAFIATAKPVESLAFYKESLGLAVIEDTPFALVFNANGTTIRIQKVASVISVPYTVLGWTVSDIAATVQQLAASGVECERFDNLPQDSSGIWETPDGAKVIWFKDPDENMLSVTQPA